VTGVPNSSEFGNVGLLGCSAPTLLANIFAENFTPQLSGNLAAKGSVLDGVKIRPLFVMVSHFSLLQPTVAMSAANRA
jgi:hypothetical protein